MDGCGPRLDTGRNRHTGSGWWCRGEPGGYQDQTALPLAGEQGGKKKNQVFSNGNYLGNPETGNSLF